MAFSDESGNQQIRSDVNQEYQDDQKGGSAIRSFQRNAFARQYVEVHRHRPGW
jgi:hypothetical protein